MLNLDHTRVTCVSKTSIVNPYSIVDEGVWLEETCSILHSGTLFPHSGARFNQR